MANVINRTTFRYRLSVNTPDFPPAEWIINPDVSALEARGVPQRHWKVVGNTVAEFTQAEKDAADAPPPIPTGRLNAVKKLKALGLTNEELIALGHLGPREDPDEIRLNINR